jgi:hypothetical protein
LLTRACEKTCVTLSRYRHPFADADPRRRFLSAVGALTDTSLRPLTSFTLARCRLRTPPSRLHAARSATGSPVLRRVPRFESEDLGFSFPPNRLRMSVRKTQDAFHRVRPCELVSPQSNPIAKFFKISRETCAPISPSLYRPPSSGVSSEGSASFWLGTCCCSRRVALQRHAGQAPSIRPSDVCHSNFSTTSTRTRWFPVHPRDLHLVWRDRFWDLPLGRGSRRFTTPVISASASCILGRLLSLSLPRRGLSPRLADAANL